MTPFVMELEGGRSQVDAGREAGDRAGMQEDEASRGERSVPAQDRRPNDVTR